MPKYVTSIQTSKDPTGYLAGLDIYEGKTLVLRLLHEWDTDPVTGLKTLRAVNQYGRKPMSEAELIDYICRKQLDRIESIGTIEDILTIGQITRANVNINRLGNVADAIWDNIAYGTNYTVIAPIADGNGVTPTNEQILKLTINGQAWIFLFADTNLFPTLNFYWFSPSGQSNYVTILVVYTDGTSTTASSLTPPGDWSNYQLALTPNKVVCWISFQTGNTIANTFFAAPQLAQSVNSINKGRQDLTVYGVSVSIATGGTPVQVGTIAAGASTRIKIYDFSVAHAVQNCLTYLYFGTNSTPTTRIFGTGESANISGAAFTLHKSLPNPKVSNNSDEIWLYASVAGTYYVELGYVVE